MNYTQQKSAIIQFKRKRNVKKQMFRDKCVFILYNPKKLVLQPHQEVFVNMGIIIQYPDELIAEFILLPSRTKHIEADVSNYQKGDFYCVRLFNKSFTDTITIEKNSGIISMYFLNDKNYKIIIKNTYIDYIYYFKIPSRRLIPAFYDKTKKV